MAGMISSAEEAEPKPNSALVAIPPRCVESAGLRIGMVFYLVFVGLVAAATLGASLGIGFYLLVHPPQEASAEPARSSGNRSDRAVPVFGGADGSRSAVETGSPAAPELPASRDEPTFRTSEAAASIPRALSPHVALLAQPASTTELTVPPSEARLEPARSEAPGGDGTLSSLHEAGHPVVQDIALDPNLLPAKRKPANDAFADPNSNSIPHGQVGERAGEPPNPGGVIKGIVTDVPNAASWVVGDRTVRLFGIDPGPLELLTSLVNWVRAKGSVECLPRARTLVYRCFTATGEDIAEAALLAGDARAGEHATAAYETAESNARRMRKGLWARR